MTGPSEDHYCSGHCIKGKCMACTAAERDLLRDAAAVIRAEVITEVVAWLRQPRGQDSEAVHAIGFAAQIEREFNPGAKP